MEIQDNQNTEKVEGESRKVDDGLDSPRMPSIPSENEEIVCPGDLKRPFSPQNLNANHRGSGFEFESNSS